MTRREVVGRRPELEALAAFVARVRDGPASLVLSGPAGMGKTTLWREGVRMAADSGVLVLSARPSGAEVRLSFSGLSDLLAPVRRELFDRLPSVQRRAVDVALLRSDAAAADADARAVATGVLSLLRWLSAAEAVVVAVDDAQWLDTATATALCFALRRLAGERVSVLTSCRTDDGRASTFADELGREQRTELTLAPLSVAAIHQIIKRELGRSLPRPTAVKVTAASEGNPFFALEIAREHVRLGSEPGAAALPVPEHSRALIRARLGRLPRRTREALLVASCLSTPTTSDVDERALEPAEQADIVRIEPDRRIRFTHPLLASAVYDSATSARRRAVHRELARRLDDPEERARHLAFGVDRPDEATADQLEEAARMARARGAPGAAAELMELSLGSMPAPDPARQFGRLIAASGLHFDVGDLGRAEALAEQALAQAPTQPQRGQALRLLGQLSARRTGFAKALELALAARTAAETDRSLAAGIELDVAFYLVSLGNFAEARPHARAAVAAASGLGIDRALAAPLAVQTMVEFLCGHGLAEADLDRAVAVEDPGDATPVLLRPRFVRGLLLLWTGRLEESLTALDAVRSAALEQGRESEVPLVFLYLVWAALWRGDLRRARRYAEDARETALLLDDLLAGAIALSASALVGAHEGRAEEARAEAARAVSLFDRLQWRAGTIWPLWAIGLLELSLGNPAAVDAALGPLAKLVAGLGSTDPVLAVFLPDQIEALIELGRIEEARSLLEPFEEQARTVDRARALAVAGRCRGLLHAAAGELAEAKAALDEALVQHRRIEIPVDLARTLLAQGRLLRRTRKRRQAREALTEALVVFERAGTTLWRERASAEIGRLGLAPPEPDGLTPTERRVAELAAAGLSNREIADRVFVSVKTVEARLSRVYRKLGIRSRAQLFGALIERTERATA